MDGRGGLDGVVDFGDESTQDVQPGLVSSSVDIGMDSAMKNGLDILWCILRPHGILEILSERSH